MADYNSLKAPQDDFWDNLYKVGDAANWASADNMGIRTALFLKKLENGGARPIDLTLADMVGAYRQEKRNTEYLN